MNFKNFFLSFGLLGFTATGATTAIGCSCSTKRDTTDDEIVKFINSYQYESELVENSNLADLLKQITPDFIKFELSTNLRDKFKDSSFTLSPKIINSLDGQELNDDSFHVADTTIEAKFTYDYGGFKNQVGTLKIPIIHGDEKVVIDAINEITYVIDNFEVDSLYTNLTDKIDASFIQTELPDVVKPKFNVNHFELNNITDDNWVQLTDDSFKELGEMTVRINYRYHDVTQETTFLRLKVIAKDEANIVAGINAVTDYEVHLPIESKYDNLIFNISSDFIQEKLSSNLQANFSGSYLTINEVINAATEERITDADLQTLQTLNAKIIYDYGTTKAQTTNLAISVEKKNIAVELQVFQLRDRKNIVNFLDGNSLAIISREIEEYLSIPSFVDAGLYFDQQTSTSVVVKALDTSEKYQGEIKITWRLKLFEIWGISVTGPSDQDLKNGLKGYFYLEEDDQGVHLKYFDTFGYLTGNASAIHPSFTVYHKLSFYNDNTLLKAFTFNGTWRTRDVGQNWGSLDFTFNKITLQSPEPKRVKYYDTSTDKWLEGANKTYTVSPIGVVK